MFMGLNLVLTMPKVSRHIAKAEELDMFLWIFCGYHWIHITFVDLIQNAQQNLIIFNGTLRVKFQQWKKGHKIDDIVIICHTVRLRCQNDNLWCVPPVLTTLSDWQPFVFSKKNSQVM